MSERIETKIIDLLHLAFKQLALEHGGQWISADEKLLHETMYKACQELSEQLPPLKKLHFATGAHLYSRELSGAMWGLLTTGCFNDLHVEYGGKTTKARISVGDDTKEFVNRRIKEIFSDGSQEQKAFNQLVKSLKPLITSSP